MVQIPSRFVILKHLGNTPSLAVCERCGRRFVVPLDLIGTDKAAEAHLRKQFEDHNCTGRSGMALNGGGKIPARGTSQPSSEKQVPAGRSFSD